jgi:hypothetical protein
MLETDNLGIWVIFLLSFKAFAGLKKLNNENPHNPVKKRMVASLFILSFKLNPPLSFGLYKTFFQ